MMREVPFIADFAMVVVRLFSEFYEQFFNGNKLINISAPPVEWTDKDLCLERTVNYLVA
jgi:hypothetical protein